MGVKLKAYFEYFVDRHMSPTFSIERMLCMFSKKHLHAPRFHSILNELPMKELLDAFSSFLREYQRKRLKSSFEHLNYLVSELFDENSSRLKSTSMQEFQIDYTSIKKVELFAAVFLIAYKYIIHFIQSFGFGKIIQSTQNLLRYGCFSRTVFSRPFGWAYFNGHTICLCKQEKSHC